MDTFPSLLLEISLISIFFLLSSLVLRLSLLNLHTFLDGLARQPSVPFNTDCPTVLKAKQDHTASLMVLED
jgi:hypothetical protein